MRESDIKELKKAFEQFKLENPKVRVRDAAKALGVSEAELVNSYDGTVPLVPEFETILNEVSTLGEVMALTRNDDAVHERKGIYTETSFQGKVGFVANEDIDLRIFLFYWAFAFAVHEGDRQSLQFFDKWGQAIHKIYLTEKSNKEAYQALITRFKTEKQQSLPIESTLPASPVEKPDHEIDIQAVQEAWINLQDTHDFFGIIRTHGLTRRQAMRIAPAGYTQQISVSDIENLLNKVSESGIDFMVFIGNKSLIQIHTGKAQRILRTGPWINILDEEFSMHLRDANLESAWIVKKPTNLGLVHSIEAYDAKGELIVQFFGKRKPDVPEREDWRNLIRSFSDGVVHQR
ncbi:MAG TPA: ChuX/HutX family heme-like substrate-binding protein [Sphingobacteriaceae bacterium]|nr:ChuX/HutX family heme-like substrate-binding protein [Sphingobacteriaceae bacterium]